MVRADELVAGVFSVNNSREVDKTLVIDNEFRTIKIPSSVPTLGVEHDDDVLCLEFKMPRFVSDTDLNGFTIRINYINAQGESDAYSVTDAVVGNDYITFSWLVGPTATRYKGDTRFNVCAKTLTTKKDENGDDVIEDGEKVYIIDREFNTTPASLPVLEGLEVDESIVSEYSDLITQWYNDLFGTDENSTRTSVLNQITDKGTECLGKLEYAYNTFLNGIPDEYEDVKTKADAIVCKEQADVIRTHDSSDDRVRGLKIFGKTTQAADPTPDSPQDLVNIAVNNPVNVCVYGKNLLPVSSVTVDNHQSFMLPNPLPVGKYTFRAHIVSNDTDRDLSTVVFMNGNDNVAYIPLKRGDATFTFNAPIPIDKVDFCAAYNYSEGTGDTATWTNIQLECGENVTEYEPYREAQSIAITIEGGLPGIPVTTGGNYTDANGQQWVCDEVDFEKGVYIQRVYALVSDYNSGWKISGNSTTNYNAFYRMNTELPTMIKGTNKPVVCTHFTMTRDPIADHVTCVSGGLSNQEVYFFVPKSEFPDVETWTEYVVEQANDGTPITTYYILNEPIETTLSAEEIAAFKALHTNYPNTTVLNDAGATMELSYNADTKTYVDNNSGSVSDEQIESVIENYLEENPIDTPDVDLTDYVKNTDYATTSKAGLISVSSGLQIVSGHKLCIYPASNNYIDSKNSDSRVLTPKNLDYAVKAGICDNSITLTDDEKAAAQAWLGLGSLDSALDSIIAIQNNLIGGDGA